MRVRSKIVGSKFARVAKFAVIKFAIAGSLACVALATSASAAVMNGSMAVIPDPFGANTSSFTASSLTLNAQHLITSLTGDLAATVPVHSDLTAYSTTITGLSASPLADAIPNFFVFSSPDSFFSTTGTTPSNRFAFNLATITETSAGTFDGTGTVVDSTGAFDPTPASFTVGFSSANNYSFTFAATPEPASLGLLAMAAIPLFRRRRAR